ncbi:MAG TPA: diguanylate cyclase [Anaeromyxobacter sp.]|nr:diguanylate cyclase [Anaeromyxobacter sp.]
MARRILVAEASKAIVTALRRDLVGTGLELDPVAPAEAASKVDPEQHVAAIVRGGEGAAEVVAAVRVVDPLLPVIALFLDEEDAQRHPDACGADGVLVGPLTGPGVAGVCRLAEKLRAESRRAAELEQIAARATAGASDLAFLKRLLLLEVKRSKRYGYPVSIALVAVDRWGELAASLGGRGSAALLSEVLGVLATSVRDIDLAVPFADERFVVLLPHTKAEGGLQVARRLCARIRDRGAAVKVTASAGVAGHEGDRTVSFGGLVKRAAEALTRARAAGGDRAEPADPPPRRDRIVIG